jgi:hypothetical protein
LTIFAPLSLGFGLTSQIAQTTLRSVLGQTKPFPPQNPGPG